MFRRHLRSYITLTFAVALATGVSACASATKRFEQGLEEEQKGQAAAAARRYIDVLRKDPTYSEARTRLLETGGRAVADDIRAADAFEANGSYMEAADALLTADALLSEAADVGVTLPRPDRYAERHTFTLGKAVDQSLDRAAASMRRESYEESIQLAERAIQRWQPRSDQREALNTVRTEGHLAWGRKDMEQGRFRSAYSHGEAASSLPGFDRRASDALMTEAIRRGTILVAVFPAGARRGVGNENTLVPQVNDQLVLDFWTQPPRWIDVVNPIEAQRVARARGLAGRDIGGQDAGSMARQLGARYAITLTLDSVRYTESKVEKVRRVVKTRAGKDTAFTVETGQLETWARVSWREIDAAGAVGAVDRGDAVGRATTQFRRAAYAGNWRDLELPNADRGLFDQRDPRDDQDMVRRVARGIADRLGRDVFDALLRRVE